MTVRSITLLMTLILVLLCSFLILNLNKVEVSLDLLFTEVTVYLGKIILSTLLAGIFITLILELLYLSKKSKSIK